MDTFLSHRPRDHLHRAFRIFAPGPYPDLRYPVMAGREQGRVPCEETPARQRLGVTLRRFQHHLDHAFDMPVRRGEPADIDPQVARGRGTHLIAVKRLALDFARLQDILGQRVENSFRPQLKAKAINATDETPLPVPDIDKARSNPGAISAESRPSPVLVDMGLRFYSSHHLRRI